MVLTKRMLQGFKNLHQVTGSPTPDIVIYNSLLWDLGRLQVHNHMQHSQLFLTQQYVNEYKLYLDQWLSVVEVSGWLADPIKGVA